MILTFSIVLYILALCVTIVAVLYIYMTRKFGYWKKYNIPGPKPITFYGNLKDFIKGKSPLAWCLKQIYDSYPNEPFVGIYILDEPTLLIRSPELIKQILVKDYNIFRNRFASVAPDRNLSSFLLFFMRNPYSKDIRAKLSHSFSSLRIKSWIPPINDVSKEMTDYILNAKTVQDAKEIGERYAVEILTRCWWNVKADCFKNSNSEFLQLCRKLFNFKLKTTLSLGIHFIKPTWADFLNISLFPGDVQNFIRGRFWDIIREKELSNINSNDFFDALLEIRKNHSSFGEY